MRYLNEGRFGEALMRGRFTPYAVSAGLVLLTFVARLAVGPWLSNRSPLLPFIAAVVVAAGLYGVGAGLLAIFLSAGLASWAFLAPGTGGLSMDQVASVAVFLVTSAAMLIFANHLRDARSKSERLEFELVQAQATAAMGTMAATLAHELNQPLTAASNYVAACGQLAEQISDDQRVGLIKGLGQAEAQIQRAGSIIRGARSLVRNVPTDRQPSSVMRMFGRVIELIGATAAGGHVKFTVNVEPNADVVIVNAVQIEQVLLNVLRNACEATRILDETAAIKLEASATEKGTLVRITDNGPGIPREQLPTLFTAARASTNKGLGIGLSICRTIIEAHGGVISAQNNSEGGASFFILLPAS
ncbi:MAG TPA: HAMP domain-containing sensor histidine kinase [Sphingomicrobium sp.]|jgi:C4-dicarboxylate-specific signal transduction histidine kinase|nr:HAMP domain-containing sensor histidine kinase [Sphingomicrobium sp.]